MALSTTTIVCRKSEQVTTSELGDELVMMHIENEVFISLNIVGRAIWEMTEVPIALDLIVKELVSTYKVDEATCLSDTLEYVQKMLDQDIVVIV